MKKAFRFLICAYLVAILMIEFVTVTSEIRAALKMWAQILLPSLFPYLVLSQYISTSGVLSVFLPIEKLISSLLGISRCSSAVYICSLFSGYPSGAVCTSELYKGGYIEKEEAERLACTTNNAGPLFLISAVGGCMLNCTKDGIAIYCIQTLSSLVTAIVMGAKAKKVLPYNHAKKQIAKPLTKCCQDSVNIMLGIGGYVVMAAALGAIVCASIERLLPCLVMWSDEIRGGVYFCLEISNAMNVISSFGSSPLIFAIICASASWGGLSVIMQICAALPDEFSRKKIIVTRAAQSLMSFAAGYAYKQLPHGCCAYSGNEALIASLVLCAIIFAAFVSTKRKSHLA
ncbi:MAG: hypothetical protein IKA95_02420 [Clostridia bacterium]|nr:hypothetical protein [Clostridia bacterium]